MALRPYQFGELLGIVLLLGSTATQMFYLDPLKREIEWRLAAFSQQQSAQVLARTEFANHIATLQAVNAAPDLVKAAEAERDKTIAKFQTADANISDFMIEKERVENYLQAIVIALFALGSVLAGIGRAREMLAKSHDR